MLQAAGAGGGESAKKKPLLKKRSIAPVEALKGVPDKDLQPRGRGHFRGDKGIQQWNVPTRSAEKIPRVQARTSEHVQKQLERSIPKVSNKDYKKMTPEQRSLYHRTQTQAVRTWQEQYGRT